MVAATLHVDGPAAVVSPRPALGGRARRPLDNKARGAIRALAVLLLDRAGAADERVKLSDEDLMVALGISRRCLQTIRARLRRQRESRGRRDGR